MVRLLAVFLALCTLAIGSARADQPTINVQIINVCADDGSNCALSNVGATRGISYNPTAIQDVFNQAGITVNVLSPVQYNNSAFLNPAVIDDPAHGYLTGSPTDPAHQLLNLPGHDQNTDPNVLNVFMVNSLPHTTSVGGTSTSAGTLYGLGLLNSNGAIATTGVTYVGSGAYVAPLDNIAHELGHNLGLTHTDGPPLAGTAVDTPLNLMDGSGRNIPRTLCGITGVLCNANSQVVVAGDPTAATVGIKDVLAPSQIAQMQSSAANLFTVDLADVTSRFQHDRIPPYGEGTSIETCGAYINGRADTTSGCEGTISFVPSGSTASLIGVKIRFANADPASFGVVTTFGAASCVASSEHLAALPAGGVELDATFDPGCFTAGVADFFNIAGSHTDMTPFSVEYDFVNGVTSTARFDSAGDRFLVASSLNPIALGNLNTPDQNGPGLFVPTDPEEFNRISIVDDENVSLPEPGTFGLLGAGLLLLMARRRLRR